MAKVDKRLSAAMWGRARFMWGMLAFTAIALAIVAISLGLFVRGNVQDELAYQQIYIPPVDQMSESEMAIPGIREIAGEQVDTGAEAKVYSEYILLHMTESAEEAGYPGATYATLGGPQRELGAAVAEAESSGDEAALEEAQANLDAVTGLRNTMLNGSNLRGQLLNSYGWDTVGMGLTYAGIGMAIVGVIFVGAFVLETKRGHLPETPRQ